METTGPGLWTDAFLDRMRETADPLADDVVREIAGDSPAELTRMIGRMVRDREDPDLPEPVRRYLDETGTLPDWADPETVARAQRFFLAHGPQMILAAFCSSMPTFYSNAKAAKVFSGADLVRDNPFLRVLETVLLTVDVLAPGGLSADGRAIRAAQTVRLVHAGVRHGKETSGSWDASLGRPINQEDYAWQLLSLSRGAVDGMRRLGVTVSDDEEAAVLHAWNAAGHVLGVDHRVMAFTGPDARFLMREIGRRNAEPSPEGRELNEELIRAIEHIVPGTMFDGVARTMMRRLLDTGGAAAGGVPGTDTGADVAGTAGPERRRRFGGAALDRAEQARDRARQASASARDRVRQAGAPVTGRAQAAFGRALVAGLDRAGRGAGTQARIPHTLTARWGVAATDGGDDT